MSVFVIVVTALLKDKAWRREIFYFLSIIPVSYTHLDVYKRQLLSRPLPQVMLYSEADGFRVARDHFPTDRLNWFQE